MSSLLRALALVVTLVLTMRAAAGRLAPRAAFAPMLFLITRWPVLVTWAIGASGFAVHLLNGAHTNGPIAPGNQLLMIGVSLFSGLGVAPLTVGPVWLVVRAFASPPTWPLEPGEAMIRALSGNHFLRGESRGGKILVTNRRLGFRPNRFNVQLATWSVPLRDIRELKIEGNRFVVVETTNGAKPEWLVTFEPQQLIDLVTAARANLALGTVSALP